MTVAEQVLNWIENYIEENRLGVGDALPGELDMVAETGFSRASVREALTALKVLGIIQTRRKGGIRIIRNPVTLGLRHYFADQYEDTGRYKDMMEFRAVMEWGLGPLALQRINKTTIKKLRRLVEGIEKKPEDVTVEDIIRAETEFHKTLTDGCKNKLAGLFVHIYEPVFRSWWADNPVTPTEHKKDWVERHGSMVDALDAGDDVYFTQLLRNHTFQYLGIK